MLALRDLGPRTRARRLGASEPDVDPRGPDPEPFRPIRRPASSPTARCARTAWCDAETGLPPIGPPWSQITAYDLNKGTILWQVPNGEMPQLVARGVSGHRQPSARAGMVVTAGGLIFIGTPDRKLRAYDQDTGKVVWEKEVSGPINGVPAVYEMNGRQYIAVCVGARGRPGAARRRARNLPVNMSCSHCRPDEMPGRSSSLQLVWCV